MVFCYKIITDTPRRSGNVSPRRRSPSPGQKLPNHVVGSLECENASVLDAIPEREWRLLAAIARKQEEADETERLADQFRRLWQREKVERELVAAESSQQYKQTLREKRAQERSWLEYKRLQIAGEQLARRAQLLDTISHKDMRSREILAFREDKKVTEIMDRALQDEARAALAAGRRARLEGEQRARRELELAHAHQRALHAGSKRADLLHHSAERAGIVNALSSWECGVVAREVSALQAGRRALHAQHAAVTRARATALQREREARRRRARALAALTAQMREDLRAGRLRPHPLAARNT